MRLSTPRGRVPAVRAEEAHVTDVDARTIDASVTTSAAAQDASRQSQLTADDGIRALRDDELEMWFQPKLEIATGEIVGAEALLRWRHPLHGVLGPAQI